jgi:DMSO reductase family type II enzyme chaperone
MTAVQTITACRAEAYGLLAEAFAYPEETLCRSIIDGELQADLCDTISQACPGSAVALLALTDDLLVPAGTGCDEVESAYLSSFELDAPSSPCPLYEGAHMRDTDRAAILLEIKSFYQHFGLSVAADLNAPEDHLAAELEFMAFLAAKQADAEQSGRDPAPYLRAQCDFLERHLGRWLPLLGAAAEHKVSFGFYRAICRLVGGFVAGDLDLIQRQVPRVPSASRVGH